MLLPSCGQAQPWLFPGMWWCLDCGVSVLILATVKKCPFLKHTWSLRALCVPGLCGEETQGGASCSDLVCKKPSKETILEASARFKFYLFIFLQLCLHMQVHVSKCMGYAWRHLSPESKGEPPIWVHTAENWWKISCHQKVPLPMAVCWCWDLCIDVCPGPMTGKKAILGGILLLDLFTHIMKPLCNMFP